MPFWLVSVRSIACAPIIGSGPSNTAVLSTARVESDNQLPGRTPGSMPLNTKPVAVGCQRTTTPVARDWALADSSSTASRWASRSSAAWLPSRMASVTPADTAAMMVITTSSSSRVKPFDSEPVAGLAGTGVMGNVAAQCWSAVLLPASDISIFPFAASHAVCAK